MEAKEKLLDLKNKTIDSLEVWIDGRIDDFVAQNPNLKIASVYMKRGAKNYLTRERGKIENVIDNAALFICDEQGNIDADMLFKDMMTMFREMDETPFGKGLVQGTVGKGIIRLKLPDNPIFNLMFGNTGAIKITEADFLELKELFNT
ncbi:hypothetical protein DW182_15790 [Bacteroides sp. AM16-24]|uniref:hypothetical protein n=1 Tax=Bacteroides sp. AM16-24 TaxID=2292002 RepID=UPI000E4C2024|nr:hypothetical protein [Bacteroides sp. AM16-24]RHI05069.1 hypothetical protein DW182_15790 [Bacteroides sp. AM16-24]